MKKTLIHKFKTCSHKLLRSHYIILQITNP